MKIWRIMLVFFSVWLVVGVAAAAGSVRERLKGEARAAFDRGLALYDAKDADGALAQFLVAYEKSQEPRLLVNLAVVERDLGHYARGLELLERALREGGKTLSGFEKQKIERSAAAFRALTTTITVESDPDGAEVFVDGVEVGTTPLALGSRVDLGRRSIKLRAKEYKDLDLVREVTGPVELSLHLEPLVRRGRLRVSVSPAQLTARIQVDGVERGSTPLEFDAEEGVRQVTVARPGFVVEQRAIDVRYREESRWEVRLRPAIAKLAVSGVSSDAKVVLDGRVLGLGNFAGQVGSGPRRLEVRDNDEVVFSTELTLRPGERRTITVADRGKTWPYWVAGGAALAGALVAGGLFLSTKETAPGAVGTAGTLNPNRVVIPSSQ